MGIFNRHCVSVADAVARADAGAVILDVRTKQELRDGTPRGAIHMSPESLAQRLTKLAGKEIYVICRSGNRSRHAAHFLRQNGIDATNVRDGMVACQRADLPVTTYRSGVRR